MTREGGKDALGARYVVVSAFRFSRKNVCNRSMQRAASTPELTSTL